MIAIRVVLLLLAVGCNGRSGPATPPVTVTPPDGSGPGTSMPSAKPTVTATVTATQPGRPPLTRLTVAVVLDNPTDAPRWFAIAKQIPPDDGAGGGVDRLEVRGTGAAVIGSFYGNGAFHAARVAPKSKVTITNLAVGWWSESPTAPMPPLDVIVADGLTLDGKPVLEWFGVEPLLADGATVDGAEKVIGEHGSADEVPVAWTGATPTTVTLAK